MMDRINAIKNGEKLNVEEVFDLVNLYECTHLSLQADGKTMMSMQVNKFEEYGDFFEFSQECAQNNYTIRKDEVVSCETEWNEKAEALFIYCQLKDDMQLNMLILFPNEAVKENIVNDFYETDIYSVQKFLDDVIRKKNEWHIFFARITDIFGFDLKMHNPFRTYISTLGDDWKLYIGDDTNVLEIPVTDDCGNLFYMKETDSSKEIIVKPEGQSFTNIKMLFFKKHG